MPAAIVGFYAIYKVMGWSGAYVLSGKAGEDTRTVWGWLTAPLRALTGTMQLEGKLQSAGVIA